MGRLTSIPGFHIDRVATLAGADPDVLRLENLDTDLRPPEAAIIATKEAVGDDEANSWLPFTGRLDLREAISAYTQQRSKIVYQPEQIVVTCGEGDAMLDALFSVTEPGDEVLLTDPTYAGMMNRVRLVGALPRLVPLRVIDGEWRLDLEALQASVGPKTRAIFLLNPAFPAGFLMSREEWQAVARLCQEKDLWLIYWSGFEGIVFDEREVFSPLQIKGMEERTLLLGCASFEQRMIGWRIGWIAAPTKISGDVARVHIYNGLVASGFSQIGVRAALGAGHEDLARCVSTWQARRDMMISQLAGLAWVLPAGGWSLLVDTTPLGITPAQLSERLLQEKVAATPMNGWGGEVAGRHLRLVFSNEPVERLSLLGERIRRALT